MLLFHTPSVGKSRPWRHWRASLHPRSPRCLCCLLRAYHPLTAVTGSRACAGIAPHCSFGQKRQILWTFSIGRLSPINIKVLSEGMKRLQGRIQVGSWLFFKYRYRSNTDPTSSDRHHPIYSLITLLITPKCPKKSKNKVCIVMNEHANAYMDPPPPSPLTHTH